MEFFSTLELADRIAFGALTVSIASIVYAYRSSKAANKSYELAKEAHEDNKILTKLVKKNAILQSLNTVKKNYIETMTVIADSMIIFDQLQNKEGAQELDEQQNEITQKIENLDEMFKEIEGKSNSKDAAFFEDLSANVDKLVHVSELMKTVENSRYRHIFRDLQDVTGKKYIP